jgi:hypothetical protein
MGAAGVMGATWSGGPTTPGSGVVEPEGGGDGVVGSVEPEGPVFLSSPPIISIANDELDEQHSAIKPRIPIIATCDIYLIATLFVSCQGG